MANDDDWLSTEPPRLPDAVIHHEPVKYKDAAKRLPRRHNGTEEAARRELVMLRRRFSLAQRAYIDAMVQTRFHRVNAGKVLARAGLNVDYATRARWNKRPDFQRALQLSEELLLKELGISPAKVLLRVDQLAEHAAEEVEVMSRGVPLTDWLGNPRVEMRNPEVALKANAKLGEHFRLWGDEDKSARVVVNIVDLTGNTRLEDQVDPIEGTAEEVP